VVAVVETKLLVVDITQVGLDHATGGEEGGEALESHTITIILLLLARASMDSATSIHLACVALHLVALVSSALPIVGRRVDQDRLAPTKAPTHTTTDNILPAILIITGVFLAEDPPTSTWENSSPT
jgi:hypothetical protein